MSIQIKLKNSVVQDSTPSTSDLPAVGEIALNANINSIGGFMRASNNTIVKIFGPGSLSTPTATTTVSGISELATNSETTTGTATNRVVTPAGLNAVTTAERTTSNNNYVAKAGSTLTGVLTMPNGSNSAPAINFGDSDSGIFGGTNTVSLAAGGTTRLTADTGVSVVGTLAVTGAITSTDDLTIPDKIIHSGDTDTAIRFPGLNTVSVETGGNEAIRVNSLQALLVGTSAGRSPAAIYARLQVEGTSADTSSMSLTRNSADSSSGRFIFNKSRGAAIGSDVVVQNGDGLGLVDFAANDGTDSDSIAARIGAFVDGVPGSNDMPGRLVFSTTADGAASPTTRLTIGSTGTSTFTGNITISNAEPQLIFTDTNNDDDFSIMGNGGNFRIKSVTDNATRFQINSGGTVDIGGNLDVGAGIDCTGAITGTGDLIIDTNTLKVDSTNNRVGILTTGPNEALEVAGNCRLSSGGATRTLHLGPASAGIEYNVNGTTFIQGRTDAYPLAFKTQSVERVRIHSGGNLQIGGTTLINTDPLLTLGQATSTTGNQFHIVNNGSTDLKQIFIAANKASRHLGIDVSADNFFIGRDASDADLTINSSGNVGIGTASPAANLHVREGDSGATPDSNRDTLFIENNGNSGLTIGTPNSNSAYVAFADPEDDNAGQIIYRHASNSMSLFTAGAERLRIDSSGNVGIGTTSPDFPLETVYTSNNSGNFSTSLALGSGTNANLCAGHLQNLGTGNSEVGLLFSAGNTQFGQWSVNCLKTGAFVGDLAFRTRTGGATSAERMRITSAGLVGIGTTSPSSSLDVNGDITISSSHPRIFLTDSSDNPDYLIDVNGGHFLIHDVTNAADRLKINSSGNVGIGISSPSDKLHVRGASAAFTAFILDNATNSSSPYKITFGDQGQVNHLTVANREMTFGTNNTERMRITGAGDLVINSSTARVYNGHTPRFSVQGTNFSQSTVAITNNSNGNDGAYLFFAKQKSGSIGGSTAVSHNTIVGQMRYLAGDGTDVESEVANITVSIDGTPGSNDTPGRISFATTNDGGSVSTERMRIHQSGAVSINTTTSYGRLHVKDNSFNPNTSTWLTNASYVASNSFGGGYCLLDGSKGYSMYCHGSGANFSIQHHTSTTATASGGVQLTNGATSWTGMSDERDKENLVTISDAITKIKTLRTVIGNYIWQPDVKHAFLIAQDVQAVLPEAVDIMNTYEETEKQRLGLRYTEVIPLLTAALQEAIAKIEILETKVAALEAA